MEAFGPATPDAVRVAEYIESASVNFDSYAIGSYAEGTYACTFPTAELKALARPDAPLP